MNQDFLELVRGLRKSGSAWLILMLFSGLGFEACVATKKHVREALTQIDTTQVVGPVVVVNQQKPDTAPVDTRRKKALVIGNGAYKFMTAIPNATHEAELVAVKMKDSGFATTIKTDLGQRDIIAAEREFLSNLSDGDSVCIYYVGYGLQSHDENFIVPIDYDPNHLTIVETQAYSILGLQQRIESRHPSILAIFLNAAYNNSILLKAATGNGLAPPQLSGPETAFILADLPGKSLKVPQSDAPSSFSAALAASITVPGAKLEEVVMVIKKRVSEETGAGQTPVEISNVARTFVFTPTVRASGTIAKNPLDAQDYVWVAPGKFKMGCVELDQECRDDERPQHEVILTQGFWIKKTRVSVLDYQRLGFPMPPSPKSNRLWKAKDAPMLNLQWAAAANYCTTIHGRLPTEAEWEFAARAGTANERHALEQLNGLNAFEISEMGHPIPEWCSDFYGGYMIGLSVDPAGPSAGQRHVRRGGLYRNGEKLRLSERGQLTRPANEIQIGFRCVVPAMPTLK